MDLPISKEALLQIRVAPLRQQSGAPIFGGTFPGWGRETNGGEGGGARGARPALSLPSLSETPRPRTLYRSEPQGSFARADGHLDETCVFQ